MRMMRRGILRNHGAKLLVEDDDDIVLRSRDENGVTLTASAFRSDGSSYSYTILLKPEEVIDLLFSLKPTQIVSGVVALDEREKEKDPEFDDMIYFEEKISSVVAELVQSAFRVRSASSESAGV
jgi:hypothetical protein